MAALFLCSFIVVYTIKQNILFRKLQKILKYFDNNADIEFVKEIIGEPAHNIHNNVLA
jgi:hypothetical protein